MAITFKEIPRILKGLDAMSKYCIYLILLEKKEPMSIPEIQKELEKRYNIKIAYGSIQSLLDNMYRAGIIDYIEGRPRKVKLLKKIEITVEDLS